MFKLAVIRTDEDSPCPFGLDISQACHTAGESVDEMQPIDPDVDDNQSIINHNISLLEKNPEPNRCKYAAHLFKKKPHVVDCNFGEADAGISQQVSFEGSPYYSQIGEGVGMGGLYNYPVTYHTDGSEYRNMYYGMTGWAAKRHFRSILRQGLLKALQISKS